MKLEVICTGNPRFPRYLVGNDRGEFYDGAGWDKDRKKAVLYTGGEELEDQFRTLEAAVWSHVPRREFTVALSIVVRAGGEYTKEQLVEYLERAAAILLDHSKATGPIEDSMTQLAVAWERVKEVGPASADEGG